ncbi:FAD-dependent oxidoreductase [Streptococcus oralis]|uniref:FAD-dependent oxidoreductase n=1 Tax=Streptococcus oralis TaxID=1303 RepID=UPI002283AA39|nr:FAD-dependent oxidoreductase [Streptococcus oralis]MCY7093959.1 FAD-dependent oxidoreductase [Streptococcus oralis]MCY7101774.1 FAD-dependent oxidoreductase [Streptococcus oralis]MDU6559161.1 FAD-dependent oxidoreductase [Streptococcus sp.]
MKIVIIGGVAGGMSAATRLRRLMEDAEITIFEKGPFVSFANCGLPYYVSGEIANRDSLLVQTPESLRARFNLDVRPFHEVIQISPEEHTVTVRHDEQEFTESYDKLILSPGAKPFVPAIEGLAEAKNAYTLRNVPDLDEIMAALDHHPKEAVVIGAGFIGLEMAENLAKRGLQVTIVEKAPHVLPPLDQEMAAFVQAELIKNGVRVITSQSATRFEDQGKVIVLENGQKITSGLTILSVGVEPENGLAKAAGIELGLRGGILVDEHYETSQKDIFAVGDAIVVKQEITGQDALISLASPANRQGRQVADVIAGLGRTNKGSIGTAIVRAFDMTAASTGLSERILSMNQLPYKALHVSGKDHAGYYPGATDMTLKLLFDPNTGKIYGAQGVGKKGVDKRIDILATAIKGNLTVFDLPELEFTYAPPFGSAKDPVNMLGYAALNLIEGLSDNIQWYQLEDELAKGKKFLDVRTSGEFQSGRLKVDTIHIPLNELRERLDELDKNQAYIVSCHSGLRSYIAERILKQAGFTVQNLDGAYSLYKMANPEGVEYGN